MNETARILGLDFDLLSCIRDVAFWNPHDREHDILRQKLQSLEHAATSGSGPGLKAFVEVFNFDIAACTVRVLSRDRPQSVRESAPFRAAALGRAIEYIDAPEQTRFFVSEICEAVGASWATLERAFSLEFGISPKSYVQARRLSAVRNELLNAEPGTLVADVANCWGFWHMGHFAAHYRKQFGELPSQTLISDSQAHWIPPDFQNTSDDNQDNQ